ncbi:DUF6893 family small protein [Streptomyces sp. NPDC060027]
MEWQWVGVAAGLVLAYGVARNLPDIRRYLRMRRM